MRRNNLHGIDSCFFILITVVLITSNLFAQNPIIMDQFTADPTARIFNNKVYLYPSHDIRANEKRGRIGWFCMEDYHVFSSDDLLNWKDHGVIVSQEKVPWVNSQSYSMWAPDCIYRDGKYYFYFPALIKDTTHGRGFGIGVAVSDKPEGPYTPQPEPIKGARGIDPNIFIDKDGQAYIFYAARNIYVAKLKDNMVELASEPKIIENLPEKGLKEGPFLFERNGIYYLTYPHVENKTERLEYATSNNPMGPFKVMGVIMDESPTCWTNHQSFINFKGQWYLFYHQNDLSPSFDKNRSTRIDSMFFNSDGTIQKVIPTLRGVGATAASNKIQIDRYTSKSSQGVTVTLHDTLNTKIGWETTFSSKGSWLQYNSVEFGKKKFNSVNVCAKSKNGGNLQIRLNSADGPVVTTIIIPKSEDWKTFKAPFKGLKPGIKNLEVSSTNNNSVEVDWISFE